MTTSKIRADYEQLRQIAQAFAGQAESARQLLGALQKNMETLQGGDWVGKGADKFYAEMTAAVLPAVQRMAVAMNEAARVTHTISGVMKRAEEESATLFRLDGAGSASDPGQAAAVGAASVAAFTQAGEGAPAAGAAGAAGTASQTPAAPKHKPGPAPDPRAARVQPLLDEGRHLKQMYEDTVVERKKRQAAYDEAIRLKKDNREILRLGAELRSIESAEAIYKTEMTQKYNQAIDLTVRLYNIDLSGVNGRPEFDYDIDLGGFTRADGSIGIGPDGAAWSPGWLASTLGHEMVHVKQMREGRLYPIGGPSKQGTLMNDVECYQWQLDTADRFGLAPDEVDSIRESMEKYYLLLTEGNQKRVNRRIFTPAPQSQK